MDDKVKVANVLRVFQKIMDEGERDGHVRKLNGLQAESDIDGYTLTITDGAVTMRVFFHNKFEINSPSRKATQNFLKRLDALL